MDFLKIFLTPSPMFIHSPSKPTNAVPPYFTYRTTFSTHLPSILLTSSLKASTSCQQSNGRRSFPRKHLTTSSRAFSTPGSRASISLTFFRFSSFLFNSEISRWTDSRLNRLRVLSSEEEDERELGSGRSEESLAARSLNVWSSRS